MPVIVSKLNTFVGHKDCIYALESSGNQGSFFSAGADGLIAQWDIDDAENGKLLARVPGSVYALHYLRKENILVIGQNFDGIHLIDCDSKNETGNLKLSEAAIFDIISAENNLVVCTGDGSVHIVKYDKGPSLFKTLKFSDKSARSAAYNPFSNELVIGYSDNYIRVFDFNSFSLKKEIEAHKISVFSLKFSPDYKYLLSGSRDAHLKIWDVENDYGLHESIVAHMYAINNIAYSPNGDYFATCSMDKSIKIWDAHQFKLLKVIDKGRYAGHGTSINKLLWSPAQDTLLSCSDDRSISLWEIKTG